MKKNLFPRLSALTLTLAMLLPCVLTAPVRAAGEPITPTQLFKWTASYGTVPHMDMIKDNLTYNASKYTHYVKQLNIPNADGTTAKRQAYFLTNAAAVDASGVKYGLPSEAQGSARRKPTQSLDLTFDTTTLALPQYNLTFAPSTDGLAAANVRLTYVHPHDMNATPVFAIDEFDVQVQVNGEWLEGSVGIRSWKLLGHSTNTYDPTDKQSHFIFDIQTEDLFDIEGFDPGDRLTNIRIRPYGEYYFAYGWFGMSDVTVNGYTSTKDFEKAVPAGRTTTYVGEEKMRDIVLENASRIAETPWTSDSTLYYSWPALSGNPAGGLTYLKDYPYRGPAYTRDFKCGYELWSESIVDGKYTGGYTVGSGWGMDCTSFAYDCYSRVSRSASWVLWQTQSDPKLKLLGSLKTTADVDGTDVGVVCTDLDIKSHNNAQNMYKAYAQLKPGDILTTYTSDGRIHIRIVDAVPEVNSLSSYIFGSTSKLTVIEQANAFICHFQDSNGNILRTDTTADTLEDTVNTYLLQHPGYTLQYVTSIYNHQEYKFDTLLDQSYVPMTIAEYETGEVEDLNFQSILLPKNNDITQGFSATVAANYHINKFTIQLLDTTTGEVLYSDTQTGNSNTSYGEPHQLYYDWYYEDPALDTLLGQLPNGHYRIAVSVLAGPVTDIRADRPTTTRYYDFEITSNTAATATVSVNASGPVTAGADITVPVTVSGSYAAADVEIKFDADKLTYVSGSVTPDGLVKDVQADKGIARIILVGADTSGKLAELTFTAKQDIGNVAELFAVKSAQLSTQNGSYIPVSFNGSDHSCASINLTDVAPGAWYHKAVDYVLDNNIMAGYNTTTFGPNDTISRAMVVQMLYNKENPPAIPYSHSFSDVRANHWANNAIAWAQLNGVVAGYNDTNFGPNDNVTLQQIAAMLLNYSRDGYTGGTSFSGNCDSWALNALSWAEDNGIFSDMTCSDATVTATRAQAAQMLMNYFNRFESN